MSGGVYDRDSHGDIVIIVGQKIEADSPILAGNSLVYAGIVAGIVFGAPSVTDLSNYRPAWIFPDVVTNAHSTIRTVAEYMAISVCIGSIF